MEPFIGQIQLFAFNFVPAGWLLCDGQMLSVSQNIQLFYLLGTAFGGNGTTTFAVPDLRKVAPPNTHYCIAVQGIFPQRQ